MKKSIYSHNYAVLTRLLIDTRRKAGLTQHDLARLIGETQSFVSKCERGERRLDLAELREICLAMGTTLPDFVRAYERALAHRKPRARKATNRS